MKNTNQRGFGAVEAIIVLVIIAAITAVGYIVLHGHSSNIKPATTVNKPSTAAGSQNQTVRRSTLFIKNWGISLKYDGTQATLDYSFIGTADEAVLTSSQLSKAFPFCGLSVTANTGIGKLVRGKVSDSYASGQTYQQYVDKNPALAATIGAYVYIYQPAQEPCSGSTTNSLQVQANAATKSLFE